jgi:hypothetical protein
VFMIFFQFSVKNSGKLVRIIQSWRFPWISGIFSWKFMENVRTGG